MKLWQLFLSVFLMTFFTACGGNNSDEDNVTHPLTEIATDIAYLSIGNGNDINVGTNGKQAFINVRALNAQHILVSQGYVAAQYNSINNYGTLTPGISRIDKGLATFTYTPPTNIKELIDQNITSEQFTFYGLDAKDNIIASTKAVLTIHFVKSEDPQDVLTVNRIVVLQNNYTVKEANQTIPIDVLAYDRNGNPIENATLNISMDSNALGTVPQSVTITNGKGTFNYTAPAKLPIDPNYKDIITIANSNYTLTQQVNIEFGPHTLTPTLTIDNGNITVSESKQTFTIDVIAKDQEGIPLKKGNIEVLYPNATNIGTFNQSIVPISTNGVAEFIYNGPNPLVSQPDQNFTFRFVENPDITTILKVSYTPTTTASNIVPKNILVYESNKLVTDVNITSNGEIHTFDIQVWGNDDQPYNGGNVKIKFPMDAVNAGIDVGYFDQYIVPCVNGKAQFVYHAPANINDRNDSFTFNFYHDKENSLANDKSVTIHITPSSDNQHIITSYKIISTNENNTSMPLESLSEMVVKVVDKDGNEIGENDGNFTIENLNPQLIDFVLEDGTTTDNFTKDNIQNIKFNIKSYTTSGIAPIKVSVKFKDANGDTQTLEKVFNKVILSGPPTAISISYVSTSQIEDSAKFVEHLVVTVTDKYFNRINTNPSVSVSLIAGYTRDANTNQRLYFEPNGASTASFDSANNSVSVDGGIDLSNVNKDTDLLMTFGNGYTYASSGKWDIDSLNGTDTLNLKDTIVLDESGLGYAIGHNYRQDTCRAAQEWVGFAEVEGDSLQLDQNGMAKIGVDYDYYLTGKDVVIGVNIVGKDVKTGKMVRIGEAKKITLRGKGFDDYAVSIDANTTKVVYLPIKISNTAEWLRNANFAYKLVPSDSLKINSSKAVGNVGNCDNKSGWGDGVAYVEANVTNDTKDTQTLTVTNIVIGNEF